jgi:hypothetical protein
MHPVKILRPLLAILLSTAVLAGCSAPQHRTAAPATGTSADSKSALLVDDLQERTFHWFWNNARDDNGLIPDRTPYTEPFSSIASIGFGLTAYGIGAERGWVSRDQAARRTLKVLRYLHSLPQGSSFEDDAGYHGFFYHFLGLANGRRYARWVEVSSVDTSLLLGGVLFAQSYYDGDNPVEGEIRDLADQLYRNVEWPWLQARSPLISMGWVPEDGIIKHDWAGYNEAMLVYVLALGSPTHPVEPDAWTAWTQTYERSYGDYQGQTYLAFGPQFGHQYSQAWIDFRGIRDEWMREHDFDYFENSRRATLAQRAYAIANPMNWNGYGKDIWGLTASDGPQATTEIYNLTPREFRHYSARGAGLDSNFDDGTLAPTAAAASIAFAPEIVIPAIEAMHEKYGKAIYAEYGFVDAFNPSFNYPDTPLKTGHLVKDVGWVDDNYIGIDQGPIVLMIENYRNGFVWDVMKRNPYIRRGLKRAGFSGGWLDKPVTEDASK